MTRNKYGRTFFDFRDIKFSECNTKKLMSILTKKGVAMFKGEIGFKLVIVFRKKFYFIVPDFESSVTAFMYGHNMVSKPCTQWGMHMLRPYEVVELEKNLLKAKELLPTAGNSKPPKGVSENTPEGYWDELESSEQETTNV